jgi:hypothetical protein
MVFMDHDAFHNRFSHTRNTFRVTFAVRDFRRDTYVVIAHKHTPLQAAKWIRHSFYAFPHIPPSKWTTMDAVYRGYNQQEFACEQLSAEAWNSGFRWNGLYQWLETGAWGAALAERN